MLFLSFYVKIVSGACMKIPELDILYESVDGWDCSGGRSMNIWGQIPISYFPLDEINHAIMQGKKSCIWTCYDNVVYSNTGVDGKIKPITLQDLPKTISATFKPTYSKFSAIAENLGMRIAMTLDMPTSYNFIVHFNPENPKYKNIINHLNDRDLKNLQKYGIVSIDFLKPATLKNENHSQAYSGDRLISFEESILMANLKFSSDPNKPLLVETWIKSLRDFIISKKDLAMPYMSKDKFLDVIKRIESRIVRSYLLREFIGDCDFTDMNSGFIYDSKSHRLMYAPNFDYGECFNSFIKTKLDFMPPPDELEVILKWDKNYINKKIEKSKIPIQELAKKFSTATSEKNILFIINNYPKDTMEFFDSVKLAMKEDKLTKLVDSYTEHDSHLLLDEEASMFKEYISSRANFFINTLEHELNTKENCK